MAASEDVTISKNELVTVLALMTNLSAAKIRALMVEIEKRAK